MAKIKIPTPSYTQKNPPPHAHSGINLTPIFHVRMCRTYVRFWYIRLIELITYVRYFVDLISYVNYSVRLFYVRLITYVSFSFLGRLIDFFRLIFDSRLGFGGLIE